MCQKSCYFKTTHRKMFPVLYVPIYLHQNNRNHAFEWGPKRPLSYRVLLLRNLIYGLLVQLATLLSIVLLSLASFSLLHSTKTNVTEAIASVHKAGVSSVMDCQLNQLFCILLLKKMFTFGHLYYYFYCYLLISLLLLFLTVSYRRRDPRKLLNNF